MSKIFIIGLPRTGTTSISVALLEMGLLVAHTAFTKKAFEMADAISDAPCFSDYKQLDSLFPNAKFIYLNRDLRAWLPSITMLLEKMAPHLDLKTGHFSPVLKRSFHQTFPTIHPLSERELAACYTKHQQAIFKYFKGRDDFLSLDVSVQGSLLKLKQFLGMPTDGDTDFAKLNVGRNVANWREYKHPNKVNANLAGIEHRKFFDYC
ncbi:MAG TPA: sulfotransferase family protein [Pseudoalteromonas prydzensis]|uniref:Sulfotransferase family protein n=1 Tax=Pseudoalteromonas prydzensis TaxID=182141 RepID=A0A7V1D2E8_9GAMM|nr:sulfotransferase [Pseudoalteromonas prydzensis]HEA18672.1 sulfotransferase family protein [Pseudoalteromonas prydzensis]